VNTGVVGGGADPFEVAGAEVCCFLDAGAGVVEEQDQRLVAECVAAAVRQAPEELLDLVAFQEPRLGRWDAFGRDRRDLLAGHQHLRGAGRDVLEQGVDRGEPLVAGADVVAAVVFEVTQEADGPVEREIADGQLGDPGALLRGDVNDQ
jgi:hypothetical protein